MFLAHIVQDMIKGASQYKGKVVTRYAVSPEWDGPTDATDMKALQMGLFSPALNNSSISLFVFATSS